MKRYYCFLSLIIGIFFLVGCHTQEKKLNSQQISQVEVEIEEISTNLVNSYNTGDSQIFDPLWTMDAFYQNPISGEEFDGRDMISFIYNRKFKEGTQGKMEILSREIRVIDSNNVVETGIMQVSKIDHPTEKKGFEIRYIKQNGGWMINNLKEINFNPVTK